MSDHCEDKAHTSLVETLADSMAVAAAPIHAIARIIRRRRQLTKLDGLDDYLLSDIGLERADVERAKLTGWPDDPMRVIERSRGAR